MTFTLSSCELSQTPFVTEIGIDFIMKKILSVGSVDLVIALRSGTYGCHVVAEAGSMVLQHCSGHTLLVKTSLPAPLLNCKFLFESLIYSKFNKDSPCTVYHYRFINTLYLSGQTEAQRSDAARSPQPFGRLWKALSSCPVLKAYCICTFALKILVLL